MISVPVGLGGCFVTVYLICIRGNFIILDNRRVARHNKRCAGKNDAVQLGEYI